MKASRVRFDVRRQGLPILVVLTLLLAANIAVWAALVRPSGNEYRDRMAGIQGEKLKELADYRDSVGTAEAYVDGLRQAEEDLSYLRSEVLSTREEKLVPIQRELSRLCAEFRIDIDTVSSKNERLTDEGLDRYAMVVPLEGGYEALRKFLQAVEASEQFLVVERVALAGATRGRATLQLNITLATYFDLRPRTGRTRGGDDA